MYELINYVIRVFSLKKFDSADYFFAPPPPRNQSLTRPNGRCSNSEQDRLEIQT